MSLNELDVTAIKWGNIESVFVIPEFIVDSISIRNGKPSYLNVNHNKLIVIHDEVLNILKNQINK